MTTQTTSPLQQLWEDLLRGTITPDQARKILPSIRSALGQVVTPESIESFLAAAAAQREQGLASGAAWAQPKPVQPVAGPIPLSPVTRTAQGKPITNVGPRTEDTDLNAAFRRGLGEAGLQTGLGSGVFGQFLRERFRPTLDVFGAQTALSGAEQGDNPFQAFAQQTRGNVGKQALGAFLDLNNRLRGGGLDQTSEGFARMQPFLAPSDAGEESMVARLAREAARGKYGSVFANQFLPEEGRLLEDFRAGPTGAQSTDLLPFLRRALGL